MKRVGMVYDTLKEANDDLNKSENMVISTLGKEVIGDGEANTYIVENVDGTLVLTPISDITNKNLDEYINSNNISIEDIKVIIKNNISELCNDLADKFATKEYVDNKFSENITK